MRANGPTLRADLAIVEQVYRNEQSFVVKEPLTGKYYRFRPVEVRVMRLFDGMRSVSEVAEALLADGVRVSAATVSAFASQLTKLGLLEATLLERTTQQLERLRDERRRKGSIVRGELLRVRFSFGNPTRLLNAVYPWVRWCFTRTFVTVSVVLFALYFAILGVRADEYSAALAASFAPEALTPSSFALLVLSFTALTFVHEMGHAIACRHFGGEVREMVSMFLLFVPAFYANVSDAWSFPERRERLWVTFAGPWIQLAVTAVIAIAWLVVSPSSVVAQFAVVSMLIGGIGNVLTNLNPLLPLDGYFALGDWTEIPNLRLRARTLATAWMRRHLLRADDVEPPATPRERRILMWYGVSAAVYSTGFLLFLGFKIIGFAERTLGALVAGLLVLLLLFLLRSPIRSVVTAARTAVRTRSTSPRRWKRWRTPLALAVLVLLVAAVTPCNVTSSGTFTMTPVSTFAITSPASGVVGDVFVREGEAMAAGAPVLRIDDFDLAQQLADRQRSGELLEYASVRARVSARAGEGAVLASQAVSAAASAAEARARVASLNVRAGTGGVVTAARPERFVGLHVAAGDTLLMLGDFSRLDATVHIRGAGVALVQPGQQVRLVSPANGGRAMTGVVALVSAAAGASGALEARVRLDDASGLRAGATGDARVVVQRATLLVAAARAVRGWFRNDLLL